MYVSSMEKVDHAPVSHATYAIPDVAVCEAMLYYALKGVHDIADTIRIGHDRLNKGNKKDWCTGIGTFHRATQRTARSGVSIL